MAELSKFQCTKQHEHLQLEGGLPRKAQEYPQRLVEAIVNGLFKDQRLSSHSFATYDGEDAEDLDLDGEAEDDPGSSSIRLPAPQTPGPVTKKAPEVISRHQKELLHRLHCNTGHANKQQMLMMLKAAGVKETVMKYVQDEFSCSQCMRQRRPVPHKQVAFPSTFSFNHILGIDFFYISFQARPTPS